MTDTFPALPAHVCHALDNYSRVLAEQERLDNLADRSFGRWFHGQVYSASAATRAANRRSMHSADLESSLIAACRALDSLPGTWTLERGLAARLVELRRGAGR